jgi:dipeptidyl aminopeptidase/acylaminoacyl peptidase
MVRPMNAPPFVATPRLLRRVFAILMLVALSLGCRRSSDTRSLREVRDSFHTSIQRDPRDTTRAPPATPPGGLFELVHYAAPAGNLAAYVTPAPSSKERLPAIVWAVGGFDNSIGADLFSAGPSDNDQSASAFREAGIVLMLPSFRGGNANPGQFEELYGEVDDFLAAVDYVRGLPYVDPERVYIGGHSTGGTLVLLAAAMSDRFRAAFAFGPVESAQGYGQQRAPFDTSSPLEWRARAPIGFLKDIRRPTFIIEGERGNVASARRLATVKDATSVRVSIVPGAGHFDVLQRASRAIARKILADTGPKTNLSVEAAELQ